MGIGYRGSTLIVDCAVYLPKSAAPLFRGIVQGTVTSEYEDADRAVDGAAYAIANEIAATERAEGSDDSGR